MLNKKNRFTCSICLVFILLSFDLCNRGSVKKRAGTYKPL